jgi:hypothetical protein
MLPDDLLALLREPSTCYVATVSDPANPSRYYSVRGRVVDATTDGPHPWYGGREQVRLVLTIDADHVRTMG